MSEFKFACPVCGQHMMCASSRGGSVMECPTCFQKIVAPNAPASSDSKFILTGTKMSERPPATRGAAAGGPTPARARGVPGALVVLVIFLFIALVVGFVYSGTIFKSRTATSPDRSATTNTAAATAPPASDTNWTLNLDAVATPETPAVGRVHGQSSTLDRAIFQSGVLTLRPSVRGSAEVSIAINFSRARPDALAGQTINVTTNADQAARVTLRWKDNGQNQKDTFNTGYALRLEFGALDQKRLPGKIYFCAPDDSESYAMGTFMAQVREPKPKK